MDKTVLAVDVDGVLNAWAMPKHEMLHNGYFKTTTPQWGGSPVTFNPRHGDMLTELAVRFDLELMWATAWGQAANDYIAPLVHLPQMPVLDVYPAMHGEEWKFGPIREQVAGRDLIWLDDQFSESGVAELCDPFVASRPERTLLVPINDATGLTADDLVVVADWLTMEAAR